MDELEKIKREKIKGIVKNMERQNYPDKPIKISDNDFESTIAKYPLVVIDCWAIWCAPCLMMAPMIEELAKKYKGRIIFGKLDVSRNRSVPAKFGIRGIPTLLVFNKGKLIDRIVGVQPINVLDSRLKRHLENLKKS